VNLPLAVAQPIHRNIQGFYQFHDVMVPAYFAGFQLINGLMFNAKPVGEFCLALTDG